MQDILAADIGGTNSRFAYFTIEEKGTLSLVESRWIETGCSTSFSHLLEMLNNSDFSLPISQSDMAVLAVAGPIINGIYSNPPNIPWDIDLSSSTKVFNLKRCVLINDFAAQAYACRSPVIRSAQQIIAGQIDSSASLAVIGAGTGLGMAALTPDGAGGYVAVPSEGGHCPFPFETQAEFEFMNFVMDELDAPYVETEFIVSGRGLSLVHQFFSGEKLTPAEVSAGLSHDSETLAWMACFYGRACRNYALQVLARGGVYIAGGVAAKMPELVTHPEFERQFRSSKTMQAMLKSIPVFLNTNEESGLWGAAFLAAQTLTQHG
ncbi:MAG: glucokinase [Deltaproteobacteria bacterium]|jgi:glucokinase|nr:glucokinase [Deltaproteobacteria bacterium]